MLPALEFDRKGMEHIVETLKYFAVIAFAAFVDWLLPIASFVGVTFALVGIDLATGIQAARTKGVSIHSRGLQRTVLKFLMYTAAILAANTVESVFFKGFPMVFSISAYIAVTELWSILENVGTVTGTNVLEAVREKLSEIVKKKDNEG